MLITGLDGETQYSFRVQATDGDATRDSKWSGVYAKTEAEQLFKNVKEEDIKAKEVTLRWTAGEEAATITLTPGNIVYNITAADIAAGAATVTGLTPETEYTAVPQAYISKRPTSWLRPVLISHRPSPTLLKAIASLWSLAHTVSLPTRLHLAVQ